MTENPHGRRPAGRSGGEGGTRRPFQARRRGFGESGGTPGGEDLSGGRRTGYSRLGRCHGWRQAAGMAGAGTGGILGGGAMGVVVGRLRMAGGVMRHSRHGCERLRRALAAGVSERGPALHGQGEDQEPKDQVSAHGVKVRRELGPVSANFAPALLRASDGCKARRAGKGDPLPSGATPQTRLLAATLRDGPVRAHPFVASRLQWPALRRASLRGLHPESAWSQA